MRIFRLLFVFFVAFIIAPLLVYLVLPSPQFPKQLPDSVQSLEEGDTETPLRRGYFTNYSRSEVLEYYKNQFRNFAPFNFPIPMYRLDYPPEDAQWLIRDQTQSTSLEELVHPFRESLFINGFEPTDPQFAVGYRGVQYHQKVTVRYAPSSVLVRLPVISFAFLLLVATLWSLFGAVGDFFKDWFVRLS